MAARTPTLTMNITPRQEEAWNGARRRLDAVRSVTGRVTTVGGAAAAVAVLVDPSTLGYGLLATTAATVVGAGTLRAQMPIAGHQKTTATALYALPGVGLDALLVAEALTAGASWGGTLPMQVLAAVTWTAATWLWRPGRVARRMACAPPPRKTTPTAADYQEQAVPQYRDPMEGWWARYVSLPGGPGVGTVLTEVERTGDWAITALIRSSLPGKPVPNISIVHLSALMDLPEDQITIKPVPGRGAGVRRLSIGQADSDARDPRVIWVKKIAPKAVPKSYITSIRTGPARRPDTDIPTPPPAAPSL